jgi:hypothetical protein
VKSHRRSDSTQVRLCVRVKPLGFPRQWPQRILKQTVGVVWPALWRNRCIRGMPRADPGARRSHDARFFGHASGKLPVTASHPSPLNRDAGRYQGLLPLLAPCRRRLRNLLTSRSAAVDVAAVIVAAAVAAVDNIGPRLSRGQPRLSPVSCFFPPLPRLYPR